MRSSRCTARPTDAVASLCWSRLYWESASTAVSSLMRQLASALTALRGMDASGSESKKSPRKSVGWQELVLGLVGVKIPFDVEAQEIDAAPAPGAAALGLPPLPQGDLRAGDVVDRVDLLVVVEQLAAVDVLSTGEEMDLRLDHVPQAVQVEQLTLNGVVHFPEGGGDAHAGAGVEAVLGGAVGGVGIERCSGPRRRARRGTARC